MDKVYKSPLDLSESITSPFDINQTSTYSRRGNPKDLFKDLDSEQSRLVHMSPNDYLKITSHHLGTTPEELMQHRIDHTNLMSIEDMRKKMREGVKFDTPWILLNDKGEDPTSRIPYFQEGLHRMIAAGQEYGMDTKFPVYLGYEEDPWNELDTLSMDDFIKHYDQTRSARFQEDLAKRQKRQEEINNWYKEQTAYYFKVPIEQVTSDMVREYKAYEDKLFKDEWNE